jgi:hypothetical protein
MDLDPELASTKFWVVVVLRGDAFAPSKCVLPLGLRWFACIDVGMVSEKGRFAGKAIPYGHATVVLEQASSTAKDIDRFIALMPQLVPLARDCGATDICLSVDITVDEILGFQLTPDELTTLGSHGVDFTVSVWPTELVALHESTPVKSS